jgi:Rod binding domain-containing protein
MTVAWTQTVPTPTGQPSQHAQLTKAAQRFVSHAFFGTVLKQMRESPFKSELFNGGRGGETFTAMLDFHLADRMARSSGRRLADSIVRHIEQVRKDPRQEPVAPLKSDEVWTDLSRKARRDVTATR